jgi:hypothetical protein
VVWGNQSALPPVVKLKVVSKASERSLADTAPLSRKTNIEANIILFIILPFKKIVNIPAYTM